LKNKQLPPIHRHHASAVLQPIDPRQRQRVDHEALRLLRCEIEDFTEAAAMSAEEFLEAVDAGYRTVPDDCDLLAVGEMGIANTTAAAMLCAALLGGGAGHVSAESGHRDLLRELKLEPLLDLNMRLGEASGAGVAILLVRAALACHSGMATFTEAGVSGAED
jgi:nicotinate-nucleotide--dimethylbenzimidazole phosphoribosyltransferase